MTALKAQRSGPLESAMEEVALLQKDEAGFVLLAGILKRRNGIDLPVSPKNLSLMASRLRKLMAARGIRTFTEYAKALESGDASVFTEFTSALTTNTTHFFREGEHFEHLRNAIPDLLAKKKRMGEGHELRVWCAAASTGQEPFTILMTILETGLVANVLGQGVDLKFLATDIDVEVLEKAVRARYREEDAGGVPPAIMQKYFERDGEDRGQAMVRMKPQYASMIRFAKLNLVESWPFEKKFDIIFCRNVLIYFDAPTAQSVIERLARQLNTGGLLYVGHSECGHVRTRTVQTAGTAVYRRTVSGAN